MVEDAGLAVNKLVGNKLILWSDLIHMGLVTQGQVDHRRDHIKAGGFLDQHKLHAATGTSAEFQHSGATAVSDHLDQHGRVHQTKSVCNLLGNTLHQIVNLLHGFGRIATAEDHELVIICNLVQGGNGQQMGNAVFHIYIVAQFFAVNEFLHNGGIGTAVGDCLLHRLFQFRVVLAALHALGAIAVHRLDDQGKLQTCQLLLVIGSHDHMLCSGNVKLVKDLLHVLLVGYIQTGLVVDVARQTQFLGHLSNGQQRLVGAAGDEEIYLLFLCHTRDGLNVQGRLSVKLICIGFCHRLCVVICQNGFNTPGLQLLQQLDLGKSTG